MVLMIFEVRALPLKFPYDFPGHGTISGDVFRISFIPVGDSQ